MKWKVLLAFWLSLPVHASSFFECRGQIAVIGFGSLVWQTASASSASGARLLVDPGPWRNDGPWLPVEFARLSKGGRITLVVHEGADLVPAMWNVSSFSNLPEALLNLWRREFSTLPSYFIHAAFISGANVSFWPEDHDSIEGMKIPEIVKQSIRIWLMARPHLTGVVWTGIGSNWKEMTGENYSVDSGLLWLRRQRDTGSPELPAIEMYIRKAPAQVMTAFRKHVISNFGWTPQ